MTGGGEIGILPVIFFFKGKNQKPKLTVLFFAPGLISRSVLGISVRVVVRSEKTRKGYSCSAAIPPRSIKILYNMKTRG